jgi:predicted RNA-binding Zn ribbon-like protein
VSDLPEDRDGFRFRGGAAALDLTASLRGRLGPSPRELLETPQDLKRWLVAAGVASTPPRTGASDLATARDLREAIYAIASSLRVEHDARQARVVLNRIAAGIPAVPRLLAGGGVRLEGSAAALLVTVAREAVELFGGDAAPRIRQCESPSCALFFIDSSRRGDRRWCSMSACGNRAKIAEFRRRQRDADG